MRNQQPAVADVRPPDSTSSGQLFEQYVREEWFPYDRVELRTRQTYLYYLDKHIIPWFGKMAVNKIARSDVRRFAAELEGNGVKASSIKYCLTILSAVFKTALDDEIVRYHPCRRVEAPPVAKKIRQIITPEQFNALYSKLGAEQWRLLVEIDIETGLRWGELIELRPCDFDFAARQLTVSRVVVELDSTFHPEGGRVPGQELPQGPRASASLVQRTARGQDREVHRTACHQGARPRLRDAAPSKASQDRSDPRS